MGVSLSKLAAWRATGSDPPDVVDLAGKYLNNLAKPPNLSSNHLKSIHSIKSFLLLNFFLRDLYKSTSNPTCASQLSQPSYEPSTPSATTLQEFHRNSPTNPFSHFPEEQLSSLCRLSPSCRVSSAQTAAVRPRCLFQSRRPMMSGKQFCQEVSSHCNDSCFQY